VGGLTIRRADDRDAAALADVAAATFALACPPDMPADSISLFIAEHLTAARFEEYVVDPSRVVMVAEDGYEAVGYALLVHGEPYDADVRAAVQRRPTTELSKIYVLPTAHGGGVARDLLAACVDAAREIGAAGMWLGTNQHNERAQRFYLKSGFERVGTKKFWVGDHWEDDYVFELALT
jgi:ribosomal protein S18 acetylase RimI-like enzyme